MTLLLAFLHTPPGWALISGLGCTVASIAGHRIYHIAMRDKRTENLAILALIVAEVVQAGLRGAVIAPTPDKLLQYALLAAKDKFIARAGDVKKAFGNEWDYVFHGAIVKEVGIGNVTVNLPSAA